MRLIAFLCVILSLACAQTALAEDAMYRCGNTYQDTPCKGVVSKPINEPKPKKPAVTIHHERAEKKAVAAKEPAPSLQADCKKRGEEAKVIAKLREINVPEQDQIAITTDKAKITLIKKVYSLSGNAFQIQNAVERECLQQNQKSTLTSQWMAKAKKLLGFGAASTAKKPKPAPAKVAPKPVQPQIKSTADPKPVEIAPLQAPIEAAAQPAPATQPAPSEPVQEVTPQPAPEPQPEPPAPEPAAPPPAPAKPAPAQEEAQADPQGICSSLQAGLKNVNEQLKKGGDAATMADLKNQKVQLDRISKSSGC